MTRRHIGLTGGIGSGKSQVLRLLAACGAVVIDADVIAREVVEPGTPGLQAVVHEFGAGVLAPAGTLDRERLAAMVFSNPAKLAQLEAIVHPLISARRQQLLDAAGGAEIVVEDLPLLVEKRMGGAFDLVVVVEAPLEVRVDRLVRLRGLAAEDVRARMANQATDEQRRSVADVVIDNGGTPEELERAVQELWERIATP